MRELLSAFGSEIFRSLMTLFAPGVVAMTPWLIGFLQRRPEFYSLVSDHHTASGLALALFAVILGMLIEDLGSRIESKWFDAVLDRATKGKHSENWQKYLRVAFKIEPVGARYIRNILLRMKFELGMMVALIVAASGLLITTLDIRFSAVLAISAIAFASLLYDEARISHRVLSNTRELLLRGLIILGGDSAAIERNSGNTELE